jgi:xanthine dehydrogenase accessory factor
VSERAALWRAAARAAADGTPAALATVARRRGSLPMASDAKMLVRPDGARLGTIGGGCLEADVIGQALDALGSGQPALVRHTLNADVAGDLGLSCGGTVELFVEPVVVGPEAAALYAAAADAIAARRRATVFTALDWDAGPRKLLVAGEVVRAVGNWPQSAASAQPAAPGVDPDGRLFIEPIPRVPRVILFGAGHVAAEIARAAAGTDFHVVVVDDREEFANRERFPAAAEVVVADLRAALDDLALDADDYVIACTRGHAMDALVVERTAASPARYVGMLGSRRKQAVIWKALETAGVPRAALERVKVPIGEAIAADTPGEIGIAVMAELIRLRRLGAA